MKVNIVLESKRETEDFLAIFALGIISALEEKVIELENAEKYLFNPYSLNKLNEANADEKLIEILHLGTELEDIKSLIPNKFDKNIIDIKSRIIMLLKSRDISNDSVKRILKDVAFDWLWFKIEQIEQLMKRNWYNHTKQYKDQLCIKCDG